MLHRLIPKYLPPFPVIVDDLCTSPAAIGRALGVSERTVRRWIAEGDAPRAASLALFWVTRWGSSALDAELHNAAVMHAGMARCLADELASLRREIARLMALGGHGSANDPSWLDLAGVRAIAEPPRRPMLHAVSDAA
jgi:hypothetical protein